MSDDLSGFSLMDLFRSEAEGQVATLSSGLIALESEASPSAIEPLMRAAHSLKGAARIVGLEAAVQVAHALEDAFVSAQVGKLIIESRHIDVMLKAVDLLDRIARLEEVEAASWQADNAGIVDSVVKLLEGLDNAPDARIAPDGTAQATPDDLTLPGEAAGDVGSSPAIVVPESSTIVDASLSARASLVVPDFDDLPEPPASVVSPLEASGRVVRVSAESLTRLMALAGESLVQARQLRPFVDSLAMLRRRQANLGESLRALESRQRDSPIGSNQADVIARAREEVERCREVLSRDVETFDEFARRGEDLAGRLHQEVIASRMRPMAEGAKGFPRLVRDLARELGKQVRFVVKGENTGVDRDILDKLDAPLNHLIRNAIDHAMEPVEERKAARKDPVGTIRLEARHSAGMLQIVLSDDGRGIDIDRLRDRVAKKGLATEAMAARLSEPELLEFLFLPGFSTREAVTEISGRGVGLDVVQDMVRTVGGLVRVTTKLGHGTRFILQLPITMSVVRALLVRVAGEPYAFPLNRIDRIARVDREEIRPLEGRSHFQIGDELVGLVDAGKIFGFPEGETSGQSLSVVVVSDRGLRFGLIVEEFLGERDLEVRPLDARLGKVPDINSISVLDDGWPVLIVDVEDLVRSIDNLLGGRRLKAIAAAKGAAVEVRSAKRILVVDDSITVRELERQLLEAKGYRVDVAVDGVDGWNAIRAADYHLVISDVDMPRMDGISLVRSIKQDPRLRSTPVVIVSYKDREEDRMRGLDAGADGYLTKSSFHDRTFLDAVADLIGDATS